MELPQLGAGACIERDEPSFERAVKYDITAGREHARINRQDLILDAPRLLRVSDVPRYQLSLVSPGAWVHLHVGAEVRSAGNVVRLDPFIVHTRVVRGDVEK